MDKTLSLIKEGEAEKAFKRLYASFPKVRSLIRKMGGTNEEAGDVFQEGLMVFYRKASEPGFNLRSTPEAYLLVTCKYLWFKIRDKQISAIELEKVQLSAAELEDVILSEKKREQAVMVLQKIGDRCKNLLLAFYVLKKNMREIANQFGYASENSAKNQKYKCLEYARNLYKSTF